MLITAKNKISELIKFTPGYQMQSLSISSDNPFNFSCSGFKFLVDSCFIILKLKENKMAYFLYGSNNPYNNMQGFTYFNSPYYFPSYEQFTNVGSVFQNQSLSNLQLPFSPNTLYVSEVKVPDTKETPSDMSNVNSQEKVKTTFFQKSQRKGRNLLKQLESAKKNCESNLVNQFLSYFSSYNNSADMIIKSLQKMDFQPKLEQRKDFEEAAVFFCKQISIVNSRRERKYVNKSFLQNYFTVQKLQKYMPDILQRVDKFQTMSRIQFCELFRRTCFNFFRTVSVSSVTSSAKLNQISRPEHIKRRRLIVQILNRK